MDQKGQANSLLAQRKSIIMERKKLRIGISHGDINGIGYELLLELFSESALLDMFTPILYGSPKLMAYYSKLYSREKIIWNQIKRPQEAKEGMLNIIDCCAEDVSVEPGKPTKEAGIAAFDALDRATNDLRARQIEALVTCPINKSVMPQDRFPFKGHTEYLGKVLQSEESPLMILAANTLRIALATTHLPLKDVPQAITPELLTEKLRAFEKSLIRDFEIVKPRIAVLALNPHSGDHGLIGKEEEEIITPTLKKLYVEEGILAIGPWAADGFFGSGEYKKYDGILAMYHDQGLAPFKALCMDQGVNITANLDYVRTSPDHGTGFDIVGKGIASAQSLRSAIYSAIDIYRSRGRYRVATAHPLPNIYKDMGNDNEKLEPLEETD